jgi:hypothetical protein
MRMPLSKERILEPRNYLAFPHIWAEIEAIQQKLVEEMRDIDRQVQAFINRRRELELELHRCRDAFGVKYYPYPHRLPLPGDIDAVPVGTRAVSGRELRELVSQMVVASNRPLTISEIHRMLLARGLHPEGRASKAISNALQVEVTAGVVVRVRRGTYGPANNRSGP